MDLVAIADRIVAKLPPLPPLIKQPPDGYSMTHWQTPMGSLVHASYSQHHNEPWERFLERVTCYWRRGCAQKMARELHLDRDATRTVIAFCCLSLTHPTELPGAPHFWYGDPPPRRRPTRTAMEERNGTPNEPH